MKTLLLTLVILLFSACKTVDFNVNQQPRTATIFGFLTTEERSKTRALLVTISIIDTNQVYPYLPQPIFWAKIPKEYAAVTIGRDNKIILISSEYRKWLNGTNYTDKIMFAAIMSHELHHYFFDSKDPETGKLTDEKIFKYLGIGEEKLTKP